MKKTLLTLALTTSLIGAAQAAPYVGFLFGYSDTKIKSKISSTTPARGNASMDGWNGGLLVGYRHKFDFDQFNLAAEANFMSYSNDIGWHDVGAYALKSSQDYSFGIDLLPGFYIAKNVNLYGIVGYTNGSFRFRNNGSNVSANSFNKRRNLNGADIGAGMNVTLANNFALNVNYKYYAYSSTTIKQGSIQDKESPTTNQFNVGVIYYFS